MKVSIIIPIYNVEVWIENTILSILTIGKDIEVILINDGSKDRSYEVCKKLVGLSDKIRLYNQVNRGVSYTRNFGLSVSTGKYILFLDADDNINKDMLNRLLININDNKSDLSVCNYVYKDELGNIIRFDSSCSDKKFTKDLAIQASLMQDSFGGYLWNKLFKKDIIIKNNIQFDESLSIYEDLLFVIEYLKCCNTVSFISYCGYEYIKHDSSAMQTLSFKNITSRFNGIMKIRESLIGIENKDLIEFINTRIATVVGDLVRELVKISLCENEVNYINEVINSEIKRNYKKYLLSKNIVSQNKIRIILIKFWGVKNCIKLEKNLKRVLGEMK